MIMGYAERIANDITASNQIKEQADIVCQQSIKIKDLVQDLNLVSRLEYEMQPLYKEKVRLSKVIRSYAVELINSGLADCFTIEVNIASIAENICLECDVRMITRAISNLIQNSIQHNPSGCKINIKLDYTDSKLILRLADNGVGLSAEKLLDLKSNSRYMESVDERLNLKHGLGLILVRQIIEAHHGTIEMESESQKGYETIIIFHL
jgi:signal transduction histidine kinase